jgi:hypothetical protein
METFNMARVKKTSKCINAFLHQITFTGAVFNLPGFSNEVVLVDNQNEVQKVIGVCAHSVT